MTTRPEVREPAHGPQCRHLGSKCLDRPPDQPEILVREPASRIVEEDVRDKVLGRERVGQVRRANGQAAGLYEDGAAHSNVWPRVVGAAGVRQSVGKGITSGGLWTVGKRGNGWRSGRSARSSDVYERMKTMTETSVRTRNRRGTYHRS